MTAEQMWADLVRAVTQHFYRKSDHVRAGGAAAAYRPALLGSGGTWDGSLVNEADTFTVGKLVLADGGELTIASGVISVANHSRYSVDTESDAASDDLDTISGGTAGMLLHLRTANNGRDVTVKHGTGNINLQGNVDFAMTTVGHQLVLLYSGTNWVEQTRRTP